MNKVDAVKWLNNLKNDIGDARHSDLWHYAEAIDDAISVLHECEEIVHCKDCVHFEDAKVNAKGFLICPNTDMDIWDECYCAHGERTNNDPKEKKGGET